MYARVLYFFLPIDYSPLRENSIRAVQLSGTNVQNNSHLLHLRERLQLLGFMCDIEE